MGALILPSQFTQQPQQPAPLDRSSPLVNGIAHCWGLNVFGSRAVYDSAGNAHGIFGTGNGGTSGNSWQIGASGYFINYDASGTGTANSLALAVGNSAGSGAPSSNIFSFAVRFKLSSLGASPSALYGAAANGGIEIRVDSTGIVQLLAQGVALVGASSRSVAAGIDVDLVVTYDGTIVCFYLGGQPAGSASSARTFVLATQYYLGFAAGVSEFLNVARLYRADIWNRVLSPAEARLWSDNPWRTFKAPSRRIWTVAASGVQSYSYTASGGIQFSGQATVTRTSRKAASGGLVLLGAATKVRRAARAAVGGALFSGQAAVSTGNSAQKLIVIASGGMLLSGAAPARRGRYRIAAGGLALSGQATVVTTDRTAPVRLNLYTIMRDSPINVTVVLAAPVNLVAPLGTSQLNLYTIMRADPINLTAPMGGSINLTGNLL